MSLFGLDGADVLLQSSFHIYFVQVIFQIITINYINMNMNLSELSEDNHQIINTFLNSHKEWKTVPDIVHLTIKALIAYVEQVQQRSQSNYNIINERFEQHKELITEQSIKLRDIDLKCMSKVSKKEMDKAIEGMMRNTTFKNEHQSSYSQFMDFREGLDKTMIQEVKTITEAIVETKITQTQNIIKKDIQNIYNAIKAISNYSDSIETIHKQTQQIQEHVQHKCNKLQNKILQFSNQIHTKVSHDHDIVLNFIRDNINSNNAIELQQIREEVKSISKGIQKDMSKMSMRIQNMEMHNQMECQLEYSKSNSSNKRNSVKSKNKSNKNSNRNSHRVINNNNHHNNNNSKVNDSRQQYSSINPKQFTQLKHKINKEMTSFVKLSQIQPIIGKYHNEMIDKYNKNNHKLTQLSNNIHKLQSHLNQHQYQHITQESNHHHHTDNDDKRVLQSQKSLKSINTSLSKLQTYFQKKLQETKKNITHKLMAQIDKNNHKFKNTLDERVKHCCEVLEENCKKIDNHNISDLQGTVSKLSEESVTARFLHFGEREIKDMLIWDKEAINMMKENFVWKNGQSSVTVVASGLYKVQTGIYKDNYIQQVSCYVIVNGEPISKLRGKQKQINKNANTHSKARGSIFSQPILLPAKSKIGLRVEEGKVFYGQAFIQIHKL